MGNIIQSMLMYKSYKGENEIKMKINKRKIQAAETKKRLYDNAKRLFLEYGVDNVSVDSIAKAAGVAKGSFYVHFESKDTLASILLTDYVNDVDSEYKIFLDSKFNKETASNLLILMAGKIAEVIEDKIGYEKMKTLYKSHITKSIATDYSISYDRGLYKMFSGILERGICQGEFRSDIPVDTLANHFILAMRGITFEWCIRYPDFNLKEQFLTHFEILLNGIKKQ